MWNEPCLPACCTGSWSPARTAKPAGGCGTRRSLERRGWNCTSSTGRWPGSGHRWRGRRRRKGSSARAAPKTGSRRSCSSRAGTSTPTSTWCSSTPPRSTSTARAGQSWAGMARARISAHNASNWLSAWCSTGTGTPLPRKSGRGTPQTSRPWTGSPRGCRSASGSVPSASSRTAA